MKKQEILNQEECDRELSTVITAFSSIYEGHCKQVSYTDTYSLVYKLCKNGQANQILGRLKDASISHFTAILAEMAKQPHEIKEYYSMISQTEQSIGSLSEVLLYVDSNYVNNSKNEHCSIRQILDSIFFQQLYKERSILERIAQLIAQSRCQQSSPEVLKIIEAINHLDEKEVFLPQFLAPAYQKTISLNFKDIFEEHYNTHPLCAFLEFGRLRLQQERQWLLQHFLRAKGKKIVDDLLKKVYQISFDKLREKIYAENSQQIFQSVTLSFLQFLNEKNDLKQINDFNDWYIDQVKRKLVRIDRTNNTKFLKEFVKQYLFISSCLSGVKSFNIGYKVTFFFEHWINEEKICLPKRLSIYFEDLILKNEAKKEDLENFTILFKFLKQKDFFEKQFRRACALRMIFNSSKCNSETENCMISQMANQCGSDWIEKLKKLKVALEQSLAFEGGHSPYFKALVFEDSVWPFAKLKKSSNIPQALLSLAGQFKEKYEQKYKGRSLEWHPFQGFAIIKINFRSYSQEFKVDTLMATILLSLQNLKFKSSVKNVIGTINLPVEEISDQLQQLERGKIIKVRGNMKGPDIEGSQIELNLDYQSNQVEGLIDLTHRYLEEKFTEKHGHQELKAERKMMVEALIVKIMKSSKTMTAEGLFEQITPMIEARGFIFNKSFVQNALAGLVDKRYIKELENASYSYLAS